MEQFYSLTNMIQHNMFQFRTCKWEPVCYTNYRNIFRFTCTIIEYIDRFRWISIYVWASFSADREFQSIWILIPENWTWDSFIVHPLCGLLHYNLVCYVRNCIFHHDCTISWLELIHFDYFDPNPIGYAPSVVWVMVVTNRFSIAEQRSFTKTPSFNALHNQSSLFRQPLSEKVDPMLNHLILWTTTKLGAMVMDIPIQIWPFHS